MVRNTIFNLGLGFGVKIASFLFSVYVTRSLGDTTYGRYITTLALVGMLSMVAEMGVTAYGLREIAKDRNKTNTLFSAMVVVRLALSIVGIIVCLSAAWILGYDAELVRAVLLASSVFLVYAAQGPLDVVMCSFERVDLSASLGMAYQITTIILGVVALASGTSYFGLIIANVIGLIITTIVTWYVLKRYVVHVKFTINIRECWNVLICGLPFALAGIGILFSEKVGVLLLSYLRPAEEVGWFGVASTLVYSLLLLWSSFAGALVPSLSRISATNRTMVNSVFRKVSVGLALIYIPIALGLTIIGTELVQIIYGNEYLPAAAALQVLVWVLPIRTLSNFCGSIAWIIGKENSMARIYIIGATTETILNVILIPMFGLVGTATAALLTSICILTQFLLLLRKEVTLLPEPRILIGGIGAAIGLAALTFATNHLIHANLVITIIISAIGYAGLLLAFRVVDLSSIIHSAAFITRSLRHFEEPTGTAADTEA